MKKAARDHQKKFYFKEFNLNIQHLHLRILLSNELPH